MFKCNTCELVTSELFKHCPSCGRAGSMSTVNRGRAIDKYACTSCGVKMEHKMNKCPFCRTLATVQPRQKLIITMNGGLVQQVFSTNEYAEVMVVNMDTEGADPDEFLSEEEIKEFTNDDSFHEIDIKLDICEEKDFKL